jgi:nitronate monooxygenase
LGSPEETIIRAHEHGIKVFCDVTDLRFALKVEKLGADAIIAVNKEAGGHAGQLSYKQLIPNLIANCTIPIISAGGIGDGHGIKRMVELGAAGVSMGSVFIATEEAPISIEYKNACVEYGSKDIVMTTKISGTPCTVINTTYVKEIGTSQNWIEKLLSKNKRIKKWFKALTFIKGMKKLEKAAFSSSYKNVWCAGPSIEFTKQILPISEIVQSLRKDFSETA